MDATPMTNTAAGDAPAPKTDGTDQVPRPEQKSLKFLYVGLAWAFGYPATACLIGYAVSVVSGSPTVA